MLYPLYDPRIQNLCMVLLCLKQKKKLYIFIFRHFFISNPLQNEELISRLPETIIAVGMDLQMTLFQ